MTTPAAPTRPTPEITILLLGAPEIGKRTFIQAFPHVRDGVLRPHSASGAHSPGPAQETVEALPWPSTFNVTLFNRPYTISIYHNTSPLYTDPFPLSPSVTILAYAIPSRPSLHNLRYWHTQHRQRHPDETPLILLGLQRDLRTEERCESEIGEGQGEFVCVMPDEGVWWAGILGCDRYVECSAVTGELLFEVLEDVTRVAARTTVERREEVNCVVL